MIRVGIVGGTGYTGVELLRILSLHPQARITAVTSRADAGAPLEQVYPSLQHLAGLRFVAPECAHLLDCDVVFFATPNGTAMQMAGELLAHGIKVIDLAADFRIKDVAEWEKWYGMTHAAPELVAEAVYGLSEINREHIKDARLVACPGCYPTAVQLGFWPLLQAGVIDGGQLIADVKSGVSGAGRKAELSSLMSECGESFKAYAAAGHRHLPEIRQGLARAVGGEVGLTFVPHLTPMIRGIHATLYARLTRSVDVRALFQDFYQDEAFVVVLPEGAHADTRHVRGGNYCHIALHQPQGGDMLVILSAIDNLVKGASGQAVQAMNIMFGFPENAGLQTVALYP
jgi:N-acetyl-gamma-glutamyl-phosphate reductase